MTDQNVTRYLERLEEVFNQMMRRMHHEMSNVMDKGVTGSQFVVMKSIAERGRMTVSAVAEDLCVSLSAITSLVDRLHRGGFVNRVRDEEDRRLVWLELTAEGEEVLKSCEAERKKVLEKFMGQLPEEDLAHLVRIYEKLLAYIKRDGIEKA